jgi:hypothetical protein
MKFCLIITNDHIKGFGGGRRASGVGRRASGRRYFEIQKIMHIFAAELTEMYRFQIHHHHFHPCPQASWK